MARIHIDPGITAVSTLYAATIGYGLQNILDSQNAASAMEGLTWPLFITSILYFMRFIIGSSNHLRLEHVNNAPGNAGNLWLCIDIIFLVIFGIVAAAMCYAEDPVHYLELAFKLSVVACLWNPLHWILRRLTRDQANGTWGFWFPINLTHLALFWLVKHFYTTPWMQKGIFGWPLAWMLVALGSLVILLWDLNRQTRMLTAYKR